VASSWILFFSYQTVPDCSTHIAVLWVFSVPPRIMCETFRP